MCQDASCIIYDYGYDICLLYREMTTAIYITNTTSDYLYYYELVQCKTYHQTIRIYLVLHSHRQRLCCRGYGRYRAIWTIFILCIYILVSHWLLNGNFSLCHRLTDEVQIPYTPLGNADFLPIRIQWYDYIISKLDTHQMQFNGAYPIVIQGR